MTKISELLTADVTLHPQTHPLRAGVCGRAKITSSPALRGMVLDVCLCICVLCLLVPHATAPRWSVHPDPLPLTSPTMPRMTLPTQGGRSLIQRP